MNERIQELADEIWEKEYWDNPNTDKLLPAQLNRFAKLIVRECIDIVKPTEHHKVWAEDYVGGLDGLELLENRVAKIKEHFGVE